MAGINAKRKWQELVHTESQTGPRSVKRIKNALSTMYKEDWEVIDPMHGMDFTENARLLFIGCCSYLAHKTVKGKTTSTQTWKLRWDNSKLH